MSVKAQWNTQPEDFSLQKNVLWKSTLEFFSAKIHSAERFVLLLFPSAIALICFLNPDICGFHLSSLKKMNISYFVTYLYQSNFCSQQKNEVGFILLSAWFPLSHWFSVMILLSFSFFWSDMQISIFIILSRLEVILMDL